MNLSRTENLLNNLRKIFVLSGANSAFAVEHPLPVTMNNREFFLTKAMYELLLLRKPSDSEVNNLINSNKNKYNGCIEAIVKSSEFKNNQFAFSREYFPIGLTEQLPSNSIKKDIKISFSALFDGPKHNVIPSDSDLRNLISKVNAEQENYQPNYGISKDYDNKVSSRTAILERNVNIVNQALNNYDAKHQIRILDVGSNSGYVALRLSENFQNVVGLDGNSACHELSVALAAKSNSTCRFYNADFIDLVNQTESDIAVADVVLLFNVVHQFIFNKGLDFTKRLLGRISKNVDVMVVELARPVDYVEFGLSHLLPLDPSEIFQLCDQCEISLIADNERPVYELRRKTVTFLKSNLNAPRLEFSKNIDSTISRKYYFSSLSVAKIYRLGVYQGLSFFRNEVKALLKLSDTGIAPVIEDWGVEPSMAIIVTKRIYGPSLLNYLKTPVELVIRRNLVIKLLKVVEIMLSNDIYQNDISLHNFIVNSDEKLTLLDYELSSVAPTNDLSAMLCWVVNDLIKGVPEAYTLSMHKHFSLVDGKQFVSRSYYPDLTFLNEIDPDLFRAINCIEMPTDMLLGVRAAIKLLA